MQLDPRGTENLILDCGCGEKVVIFGRVEDWLPREPVFRCACGEGITFSDRGDEGHCAPLRAS